MAREFYTAVNLQRNELQQARIENLATAPSNPVNGLVYYNTSAHKLYYWSVDHWVGSEGILYRGIYDNAINYDLNDVVVYQGNTYIMTGESSAAGVLPTNTSFWSVLAQGGVLNYTNATPTPVSVGGIPAGQTFDAMGLTSLIDLLLYPYQSPAFTSFSISGQATTLEVGTTLSGSKTFTWGANNSGNINTNSVSVYDGSSAASPVLLSGQPSTGSAAATISSTAPSTPTSRTFFIRGQNNHSVYFTSSFSVAWQWKKYYGTSTSTTLDENAIEALATGTLSGTGLGTYSYAAGGYKYLAYPASLAAVSAFKDTATQLSVDMADSSDGYSNGSAGVNYALTNVTNAQGVTTSYRVYRTKYQLGGSINIAAS